MSYTIRIDAETQPGCPGHEVSHTTEVTDVESSDAFDDLRDLLNPRLSAAGPDAEGDHPDPVTLSEPVYDDQGLLRWSSLPPQGP